MLWRIASPIHRSSPARALLAVTLVALSLLAPRDASAHGESPQIQQVLFHPANPDVMVVVGSFGLMVTEDRGATWDWICPEAFSEDFALLGRGFLDAEGTVTLGLPRGLVRGEALGCEASRPAAALDGIYVVDLHSEPADPDSMLALTFESDDSSAIHAAGDSGRTWTPRSGLLPPRLLTQSVRAAPSDPLRVYVSGVVPSGFVPTVYRSDGGGDVWTPFEFPAPPEEFSFYLLGVSPDRPDRVYLRAVDPNHDRIALSEDGATTFVDLAVLDAPVLAAGRPFGFAVASDGAAWVGNPIAGLFREEGAGLASRAPDLAVTSIEAHEGDLWIGLDGRAGDDLPEIVRALGEDPTALEPVMSYEQLTGVRTCTSPRVREICEPLWDDLRRHVGLLPPLVTDAGVTDAGLEEPPPTTTGCGCRMHTGQRPSGWVWFLLGLAIVSRRTKS